MINNKLLLLTKVLPNPDKFNSYVEWQIATDKVIRKYLKQLIKDFKCAILE